MSDFRSQSADQSSTLKSAIDLKSEICNLKSALRRFRLPIPTRVQVQEGRPIRVITDRQGFTSGAIVQAAGPWRTSGEWWNEPVGQVGNSHQPHSSQPWDRDEWDVAMADGTIYRLVVERGVGQWFLEGVVD
jgi:protein ImuB